jgi:hypothetical protein
MVEPPGRGDPIPAPFGRQLGEVVFVDGRLKVTRESVCRDVQLAGVSCP